MALVSMISVGALILYSATLVAALSRVPFIVFRIIRIQKMLFVVSNAKILANICSRC